MSFFNSPDLLKLISNSADDEIMELLWQNGQVVTQTQNHRYLRKPPPGTDSTRGGTLSAKEENYNQHLFMQEGEMASWLHYPINDDDDSPFDQTFSADFLNPPPTVNNNRIMQNPHHTSQLTELRQTPMSAVPPRPPIPPPRKLDQVPQNFAYFARHSVRTEPGPSSISRTAVNESTGVDSCDTPAVQPVSETVRSSAELTEGGTGLEAPSMTCDEPGGSSSSGEAVRKVAEQERKRKGREAEEWEDQSEVSELTQCCYFFLCDVRFRVAHSLCIALVRCRHSLHPRRLHLTF